MSVEVPQQFVGYAEERGCEVHVQDFPEYEDDTDWHPARTEIYIRKEEVVGDRLYMQALSVHPRIFDYPDRWEMMFDILELGLDTTIRRGQARFN